MRLTHRRLQELTRLFGDSRSIAGNGREFAIGRVSQGEFSLPIEVISRRSGQSSQTIRQHVVQRRNRLAMS